MEAKKKARVMSLIFGVITILVVFSAFSFALNGGFKSSIANLNYIAKISSILVPISMIAIYLFDLNFKSGSNKYTFIFGSICEVIIFLGVYIHTAMIVHV